ncbi:hypothetical protein niasHT_039343 [Heterodera trifolii]|uniref:Uncharacterized protein n=1 Tax=Heterodera trifolii TaxID=157864 RepID=A0ABD2IVJ4_9BILA
MSSPTNVFNGTLLFDTTALFCLTQRHTSVRHTSRAFGDHSLPNKNILRHSLRSGARKNASSLAIVSTLIGKI